MSAATTPATDAEGAEIKTAAERARNEGGDWHWQELMTKLDPARSDGGVLALIARLDAAERERDEARRRELDADRYGEERNRETQARALAAEARAERLAAAL